MKTFDLNSELEKIKNKVDKDKLGMILIHNGIVRKTPKEGDGRVASMNLTYNREKLNVAIETAKNSSGVEEVFVWINEGHLNVGDDIMYAIVAGDRRSNILQPFEKLIENIKNNVVTEKETILKRT